MANSYIVPGGAGYQGQEIVRDLLSRKKTMQVCVIDSRQEALDALEELVRDQRLRTMNEDATDFQFMKGAVEAYDVIVSCMPYNWNLALTRLAIEKKKHMVDLGGNVDVEAQQDELHEEAKRAGSKILKAQGIAPGAITIIAQDCIDRMGGPENVDYLRMLCGGLPVHPRGILKYMEVFSKKGWFNEIREPCDVIQDYRARTVEPMTGYEQHMFPEPFGNLEAVNTSGGVHSLIERYAGTIRELSYKTLRYPGHWAIMNALYRLGYLREDIMVRGVSASDISEEVLGRHISYRENDAILARWVVGSVPQNGKQKELEYNLIILGKPDEKRTAMQIATADSASIVAQMAANNTIKECGVLPPEAVPSRQFIRQWALRGIHLTVERRRIQEDL